MTAQEIYDQLKTAIDDAVSRREYLTATATAERLGMTGGERNHPTHLADYGYEITFEGGDEVIFEFQSYDASKTFEIKPDVNRFDLQLKRGGKQVDGHSNRYTD